MVARTYQIRVDREADAAYIDLTSDGIKPKQVAWTRGEYNDVHLDFDKDGRLLGIEILDLKVLPP